MADIKIYADKAALAEAAAEQFTSLSKKAIAEHGRFAVALSGGSTPKALFELLAKAPYIEAIDWQNVHIFWGDERTVPPDYDDSNYGMAYNTLLKHVALPDENIHRMRGEMDAAEAALEYEHDLRIFFGADVVPTFDLIHLGMGDDGHTASLFPATAALEEKARMVVANYVPQHETWRITLTAPVINAARQVTFLVAGANKAARLNEVLNGAHQPEKLPSQLIKPQPGNLTWLLDEAAASDLPA